MARYYPLYFNIYEISAIDTPPLKIRWLMEATHTQIHNTKLVVFVFHDFFPCHPSRDIIDMCNLFINMKL